MKVIVDTQDPTWREQREQRWARYFTGNEEWLDKKGRRERAISHQIFMGDITFPLRLRAKRLPKEIAVEFVETPHQSMSNWRWFITECAKKYPTAEERQAFIEPLLLNQESANLAIKYGWSEKQEIDFFQSTCLDEHGILSELGVSFKMRPDWIFSTCANHFCSLLTGKYNPLTFQGQWYEWFKQYSWLVEDSNVFLPESGCTGEKTYPLRTLSDSGPEGTLLYPEEWHQKFTKYGMNHVLGGALHRDSSLMHVSECDYDCLDPFYQDVDVQQLGEFPPLDNWRKRFMDDLESGGFPPSVEPLKKWLSNKAAWQGYEMSWMTEGRRAFAEAEDVVSEEERLKSKIRAEDADRQKNLLAKLSERFDGSPALRIMESVRLQAVSCQLIKPSPAWGAQVSVFATWLSRRHEGAADGQLLWDCFSRLSGLLDTDSVYASTYASWLAFPERSCGFYPVEKHTGGDSKGNRVYKHVWDQVLELLAGLDFKGRAPVSCKARPIKDDTGSISGYKVMFETEGQLYKYEYDATSDKEKIVRDIRESLVEFAEESDLKHQFYVVMETDGPGSSEFIVQYMPAG